MEYISCSICSRCPQSAETLLKSTYLSNKKEIIALCLRSNKDLDQYWKHCWNYLFYYFGKEKVLLADIILKIKYAFHLWLVLTWKERSGNREILNNKFCLKSEVLFFHWALLFPILNFSSCEMNTAIIVLIEGVDSFERFVYTRKKYLNSFYRKKNCLD